MAQFSSFAFETVWNDGEFLLSRSADASGSVLLVLAPAVDQPAPTSIARLEHAYELRNELDSHWAARPLALIDDHGKPALLIENHGGEVLARLLRKPWELKPYLPVAIGMTVALGRLHQRGLIHRDIKPTNVFVNVVTGQAWLSGFGLASRLPRERQSPEPPESIAGTLAYMAPEQTGRMNRSIDSRSDLYSLGVTFYEMLTGELPFAAFEPMEWIHSHVARQPVPPRERRKEIPGAVSTIIVKLLAKNAEDRYQTAAGVEADLRKCLEEWESRGCIDAFPLGTHDVRDRLLIAEKLYGRAREVEILLAAFDRVVKSGVPELVLVSGYSGIGKSSVVSELHKELVVPRGLFASGKFDQYKRDIPYATLAQAFQGLLRPLLSKSEAELSKWRDTLREALDPNGQLIVDLAPELKLIIGEQQPVPEVPPQDTQRRFHLVLGRFIGVFARPEHPLALFLDDLQWLDAATLDLLEDLLTRADLQHLLLVGAYRDNEVDSFHPLTRKLDAIRKAGAPVQEIILAPLTLADVAVLITDSFHPEPERAAALVELIHEKTAGNPFFVIQFISALVEEGLLTFDYGEGQWSWDLNTIRARGYTDNVADLMVGKLKRLPIETQQALQLLACLGNRAEFDLLEMVSQQSSDEMHARFWEATRTGLVFRSGDSYWFLHDRVQEAAYSLIPQDSRANAHLRIGRLIAAATPHDKLEERIFEIVNQLNRGVPLVTSDAERLQIAELNLIAARRARASTAYKSALVHLAAGEALLSEEHWETHQGLRFPLALHRAECEFLTGELTVAEERLVALSNRATTTVEQAIVACLRMEVCTTLDQSDRAVAVCLDYLRHIGIEWLPHPQEDEVRREYERISSLLAGRTIEDLIDLPLTEDVASLATVDVLSKVRVAAGLTDANLGDLTICKAVSLSLERGNCDASCFAYVMLSKIAGPRFGDYQAGFRFGQLGYELVERRGLKRFEASTYLSFSIYVVRWIKHVRASRDLLRRAFEVGNRNGDITFAAYACTCLNTDLLFAGEPLADVQGEAEQSLVFAEKARFGLVIDCITTQLALIRMLRGLTPKFGCFDDGQFNEVRIEHHLSSTPALAMVACWYWIRKLQARYIAGDYAAAMDAASKAQPLLWTSSVLFEEAEYHFHGALVEAAYCNSAPAGERQQHIDAVAAHHRQLQVWAKNCPENFENRAALVSAEIARIQGRELEAEHLYEQAIRSAHENGFVHNEAIANELAAHFYAARGFEKIAHAYLQDARYGYLRWGADGKVRQLDQLYPHLKEERSTPGTTNTIVAPNELLDLATVIKVSQAASGEILLEKLIDKLMRSAVELAGAERGLLILPRDVALQIEAEAVTSGDVVSVKPRGVSMIAAELPESLVRYVMRTQETLILDDALSGNSFSGDPYIVHHRVRSILCLPLINQARLIGVLYLENNLTPHVFNPTRIGVLELLASQAAISLENASLYSDLQRSDAFLAQGQTLSHTGSFGWSVLSGEIYWSEETYRIFEHDRVAKPTLDEIMQRIHPDDRDRVQQTLDRASEERADFDFEHRLMMPDGSVKYVHVLGRALKTSAETLEFAGAVTDVTAAKRAEAELRDREAVLLEGEQLTHTGSWQHDIVSGKVTVSPGNYRIFGVNPGEDLSTTEWLNRNHPDDQKRIQELFEKCEIDKIDYQADYRIVLPDGTIKHLHAIGHPVLNDSGDLVKFIGTTMDVTEQVRGRMALEKAFEEIKALKDQLDKENQALRDEVDRASMFEEIVGASPALRSVLARVAKVGPTDSTVLITGETGTGKELIARAIHKRSRRSGRAFVSVNCAALAPSLISSELFGHERGAFTGAIQRRLGRFELADGGTIFLDEIGELPAETQVALLRVLQEREFERLGGTHSVRVDVRVIAATNRDLKAATAIGAFRQDLFYRLNVFPIEVPPLRERKDDVVTLVHYYVNRYATRAGKNIRSIDKKTLELLQSYDWPGNIRELQNVVERSVVLSSGDVFSVDESWLSKASSQRGSRVQASRPFEDEQSAERELIEAALKESRGRVAGPNGAAAKLGIPRSTLAYKIKTLDIRKSQFKFR